MRVFINALCAGNRSGTGRYAAELCRALPRLDAPERFICLVERHSALRHHLAAAAPQAAGRLEILTRPPLHPILRGLWESTMLAPLARRHRADVFHGPAFIVPRRLACPSVVTIHDCAFLRYPETIRRLRRFHYRRAIPRSARAAARVAVDSESARRDAIELLGLPPEKVRAIPLGVGREFFVDRPEPQTEARLRGQLGVSGEYLLTVGTLEPRKNLDTLIRAYAAFQTAAPGAPPLVIAGRAGWMTSRLAPLVHALGLQGRVRFAGFVDDADLPALISLAACFLCVSYYEGFGLPALEAMAAGAPVIVSNTSSLPEVVGEAGELTPPHDVSSIAESMRRLWNDRERRLRLREAGRRRAREFTWERTARETLQLYREASRHG